MKNEVAMLIQEASEELEITEVNMQPNYSGRGMFGKQTMAITGPQYLIIKCIAKAGTNLAMKEMSDDDFTKEIDDFVDEIGRLAWDAMGRDSVCY